MPVRRGGKRGRRVGGGDYCSPWVLIKWMEKQQGPLNSVRERARSFPGKKGSSRRVAVQGFF